MRHNFVGWPVGNNGIMACVTLASVAAYYSHMILHMIWNTLVFAAITLFVLYFLYAAVRQTAVIETKEKKRQQQLELQRQRNRALFRVKFLNNIPLFSLH